MALATNTRFQLADRLSADLSTTNGYVVTASMTAGTGSGGAPQANDPLLMVSLAGTNQALICISQRHFNSFNVVAELSSSAAEGLPEHVAYVLINSAATQVNTALISAIAKRLGTSSIKLAFTAVGNLDENHMTDAAVSFELANDSRNGASGQ